MYPTSTVGIWSEGTAHPILSRDRTCMIPRTKPYTHPMAQTAMHDGRVPTLRESKRDRQSTMRELVTRHPISSQQELVDLLATRGFSVTQAKRRLATSVVE